MPWLQRYSPTKLCDGAQMDTMCGCMADIQSAMAENRWGKKRRRKTDRKKKPQDKNIMACSIAYGGHNNLLQE